MSHVVLYLNETANRPDVIHCLRRATHHSLGDVRQLLTNSQPIVEVDLFDGNYDAHAQTLRAVLGCIDEFSLWNKIYELPEGSSMSTCTFVDKCEISPNVLRNILDEADAELARQLG